MTVTPTGEVRWSVPADQAGKRVEVVFTAKTPDGREAFQNGLVAVVGR
jgi:hypothetical protein